jgi:hypothetical protein
LAAERDQKRTRVANRVLRSSKHSPRPDIARQ